jgi:hypothetical protein
MTGSHLVTVWHNGQCTVLLAWPVKLLVFKIQRLVHHNQVHSSGYEVCQPNALSTHQFERKTACMCEQFIILGW